MSQALTRMRIALRAEGIDQRRSESLLVWARSFLAFCNNDDAEELNRNDVEAFLNHISGERFAGRPARNRALDAIEWLFRNTPGGVPGWLKVLLQERRSDATPNVLSQDEVRRLLRHLSGNTWLAAALVYGTGMRLLECVRLRVRDVDLQANRLIVREGSDRVLRRLALPDNTEAPLQEHLEDLKLVHIRDIVEGNGCATLPPAVAARSPNVASSWSWQYLFPQRVGHQSTGAPHRQPDSRPTRVIHHLDPQSLHRKFERAAMDAGIYRRVTGHVLRNSFALHMIEQGVSVKRVERMLGTNTDGPSETDDSEACSLRIPAESVPDRLPLS